MTSRGSEWRRWEPHVHAPDTLLNNQFGVDAWNPYIKALEEISPKIGAIGVTDYYLTGSYVEMVRLKVSGRLPDVQLIFPNIEVRLDVASKQGFVNLHLLVSPEDPEHLAQVQRILARLQFQAHGDSFNCTRDDLIRLGKKADASITDDGAALKQGALQFKVNFKQLRSVIGQSEWARSNILIAVAGGSTDGTSGLQLATDTTIRQEIENFADIIFSSSPKQREFWLGQRAVGVEQLRTRYGGCKPCLHGSDAHTLQSIGQPASDRFSWIKGALTFDALRQACIDPEGRAYVGNEPPSAAIPSQVISHVDIENSSWAKTKSISLNAGLVAVIGARGSGKTALADMIAAGCDAIPSAAWRASDDLNPSFLVRARPLIEDGKIALTWGGGEKVSRHLDGRDADGADSYPRARYLSQQFVEDLCSSSGASEGLVREIERVIFEAHSIEERDGATDFAELREHSTRRFQQARQREVDSIRTLSERIAEEFEKEAIVASLASQIAQKEGIIKGYNSDLSKLTVKGAAAQTQRHAALSEAAQKLSAKVTALANQRRIFLLMKDEVKNTRDAKAPEILRETKARYTGSGLTQEQWDAFLLIYKGNVDKNIEDYIAWADSEIAKVNGALPAEGTDPKSPLVPDGADLTKVSLNILRAEIARLEKVISADATIRNQYSALSKKIATENGALQALKVRHEDAEKASERRKALQKERDESYGRLFEALTNEQQALADLYAPLMKRLAASTGTLQKLSFTVTRVVDAVGWATHGEDELLDCRKSGDFYGRGALGKIVSTELRPAWESGTASDVQSSMADFIAKYTKSFVAHAPFVPAEQSAFRAWSKEFAHWLFNTDHINIRYEIAYDGIDIRKLSPGTRGIVLLLLYLALDDADDRPLIIDQPEENLDPKSVFDELVALFVAAKRKRQVIMVTHNANLVVNTDADQIIVASAGHLSDGGLPEIAYATGGLEDAEIRQTVCDILEGGAEAFRERARRLRVALKR